MAQQATVLILADVDDVERTAIESACADAGFSPASESSAEAAISKLTGKRFDAFVVHLGTPGAALACMRARGKLLRIRIPVIALVDGEDDAGFARAYRAGADEVLVSGRPAWLTARLRALPKPSIPQPGNLRGDAVVADADRTRAEVLERVLRDAGFRVEVAVDGFSTRLQAGRPALKVAVVDASLDDVPALITQARAKGARCAWVVRARPEQLDELRQKFQGADRVSVVSAYGPPDDVLFETNRLLEQKASNARADARLLHGTILRLKWGGEGGEEDIGYTYNVSSLGLYVRTLVAPAADALLVDVTPPGGDARVRLEGKIAWRREFGTTRKEPVPAGFGVQIVGGDIERWAEACPRVPSLRQPMPAVESSEVRAPRAAAKVSERPSGTSSASLVTAPGDIDIRAREPQPSVEEMLASVLSETIPDEEEAGSAPLSIDGDSVVELDAGDRMTELPDPALLATQPPPVEPSEPPSPDSANEAPAVQTSEITSAALGFDLSDDVVSLPAVSIPIADVASAVPELGQEDEPRRESTARMVVSKAQQQPPEESVGFADTMRPGPEHEPMPETRRVERAPSPKVPSWRPSEGNLKVPKTGVSPMIWGLAAFLVAGAVAAIVMPSHQHASTTPVTPSAAPVVTAVAVPVPSVAASAEPAPAPSVSAEIVPVASAGAEVVPTAEAPSAAPSSVPSAAPSAEAVPAAAPAAVSDDAAIASLKKGFAVLYVDSPVATNVYVYGLLAGTTNQPITTKCGPRFLRLGTKPGAWQGDGVVQIVKCGAVTHVAMSGQ